MLSKSVSKLMVLVLAVVCFGMFCTFGYANAGTLSASSKVFNSDGVTPLPGTGLTNLGSADPALPYGYVQCIFAGADGEIDSPDTDGSTTDDDVLLETAEYSGQFFTAIGEGFPFFPNGRFFEDFSQSLNVGSLIYCRVWNGTSPSTSTHYGDSGLYSLADNEFDNNDFGTWSTDIPISVTEVPEIDISPMSLDYGDVFIGSSSSLLVTIANTGTADLDVTSIALGMGTSADFAITSGPSSITLVPGANVTVQVTYTPSDQGADSGTLVIESYDADEAVVTVSFSGNGVSVPVPEIVVSPMSVGYGDVYIGSTSSQTVTITNTGTADLDVTSIALGAGTSADFAITSGPGSTTLVPGANVAVDVTYSPSDGGTDSGTLVIESDDADEPVVTVSLSGNGVAVPVSEIDVSPMSLTYGDVYIGSTYSQTVTITNTGTADLDVTSIDLGMGTSADFAITSGPGSITLVPGANVAVDVTYSPSDGGTDSGTLVIESDDADEAVVTVSLSGNGVAVPVPEIDVSPMSLTYGDVFIGSSSILSVTITNTGTADLDVTSIDLGMGTSADFAITSGPGSITLVPGANVAVDVTYGPSDGGTDSGTLVIASNDADEPVVTVSLSGNGVAVPVPEIDVSPMSLTYGDVFIGSSTILSVTITNTGTADLDVTSIDLGMGTSADFAITSGPGSITLVPGANVAVDVTYSPSDGGTDSGTLVIESDDADEPVVTVSLSGNGVAVPVPEIDVNPMSLTYGDVFIGSSTILSVTIANTGTADLDVTSIALGAGTSADFAITSGPGSITLVPGANVAVDVTYSPSDGGTDSGTFVIESDDADEPVVTVSLSGNGVALPVPEIDVTPLSVNYGDVYAGSTSTDTVTISNIGSADLEVTDISLTGSADFVIMIAPLTPAIIIPGASVEIEITYSPTDTGFDSGTLVIESDDADEPTVTVSLSGNGVAIPVSEIDVNPMSLTYGDVFIGSSSILSVTITNTGTADLDVTSIALGAGTSADFAITSGPGSTTLVPGANVAVEVTYSPSDGGTDSGTLVIASDDADEPMVTVSLSGNGVAVPVPEIDISPMSLDYGNVFIGSSSSLSVTITNTGTADLDITSIALGAGTSADFAITSGPGSTTLVPGANFAVDVTYSPSGGGTDSGTLVIASDDADEPLVTVSLSGNGVPPVPEIDIDVSPMSLDYGDVFVDSSLSLSVTIANIGTADFDVTSIASGAGTSADFAITSGPGSTTLVPGANVAVDITYSPSDVGPDSGTLVIATNDADEPMITVSLSGNGVAVPVPEIDVSPLSVNYGDVYAGSTSADTFTISNIGSADLEVTDISLTGSTDFVIIVAPLTPAIIIPGASVEIEITYSPTDIGSDSAAVEIASTDSDEPLVTVALSGNGVPVPVPEIDVSPISLDYGDVFIGSFSSLSVTIANTGTADLDVTSIDLGMGTSADFAITSGPASIILVPGANVTVQVTYSPSDQGADSGTLVIKSDDADEPVVTVSLSGNGVPVPEPEIDVSPMSLSYGDVYIGSCNSLTVTISNTGTADLDVSSIALGTGSSADYSITTLPSTPAIIIPGAGAQVEVTYCPTDTGFDSGTLVIESDDADEPTVTVSLSGNGVAVPVPEIDVNPMSLTYGDVYIGSTSSQTVTIANSGTADLDVTNIDLGVGSSADFVITSGPSNIILVPGANVTIQVTYSPSDQGVDSGTLVIESDDADEPVVTVSLSGNGVAVPVPEIDVSPISLDYGDVVIGSSSSLLVTIANTGTADLDVTSIDLGMGTSADFAITSGPASITLVPGANVTVQVTYSPYDEGFDSGTLVIESDDADEPVTSVSLSGDGIPATIPQPELCPDEYRWGDPAPGYSYDNWPIFESWMEVHFVNSGSGDAFNVTATITYAPANVTIVDGDVTLGDIPAGDGAWSEDFFELEIDMTNPQDPDEGILWQVEYDDAAGVHHVIENVSEFCEPL